MVQTSESEDQPVPSSSSSAMASPIDLRPHGTLLLHTPKTLQSTQAAQNQPLKQYFQSDLYHLFSCRAREVIERVEAERRKRRDEELRQPVFRPTKFVKPPMWTPDFPPGSRTRKPLVSPNSSPPLVRRPLEQATSPAELSTEKVQALVAKPFNTICKGVHGYDDEFPILMTKPNNNSQAAEAQKVGKSRPKRYKKKWKDGVNSGQRAQDEKLCKEIEELLKKTECPQPLEAVEYFKLLPARALAQIFLRLDARSLGAFRCTCQDFKWLIEMYEVNAPDTRWVGGPAGKV
ncbi:uncharacterized protein LOC144912927 [Branchiostoma floridae x Branchiostoma belcheri]